MSGGSVEEGDAEGAPKTRWQWLCSMQGDLSCHLSPPLAAELPIDLTIPCSTLISKTFAELTGPEASLTGPQQKPGPSGPWTALDVAQWSMQARRCYYEKCVSLPFPSLPSIRVNA